jgi:hypothetical protein
MGIGMVLLAAAIVGTFIAFIGGAILGGATAWFTIGVQNGRRAIIIAAVAFPFVCLAWAGLVFACQAVVNETILHRDAGLGDAWECPLPNGYALLMIDVTDSGWVYNPNTQRSSAVSEQQDAPYGVRLLQVTGRYVLGGLDSKADDEAAHDANRVDSYFIIDAVSGQRTNFSNSSELAAGASALGVSLKLEPIAAVYRRYRFTWFDAFAALLLFAVPFFAGILVLRWILRLRKSRLA